MSWPLHAVVHIEFMYCLSNHFNVILPFKFPFILKNCCEVRDEDQMSDFSKCRAMITHRNPSNAVRCRARSDQVTQLPKNFPIASRPQWWR